MHNHLKDRHKQFVMKDWHEICYDPFIGNTNCLTKQSTNL